MEQNRTPVLNVLRFRFQVFFFILFLLSVSFQTVTPKLRYLGSELNATPENDLVINEFEQRQFKISNAGTPTISNINLNPELNISYFGSYQIQAEVIVPVGTTINSVSALVTPLNGEGGSKSSNYFTNGTSIGDETKTFPLTYDGGSGKYLYNFLRPDDIYPEIGFLLGSVTHGESPSNILVHQNQYHMMHFQNPFAMGDNTSFFIEFYTVPVSLAGPPSVDMQVYLVKKQKTTTFFQSAWINSPDVELVGTINRYDDFNHSHSANSRHHVIRLSTNADGTIGNKQLDISDDFWIVLYAPTQLTTRAWNMKFHPTYNNNSTWYVGNETGYTVTARTGCPDVHIHVARNNTPVIDRVDIKVTVNYDSNLETFDNENYSFGQLQNLPPNASTFILPEPGVYSGLVNIEWHPATDPNNDPLTYNLYLIDITGTPDTTSVVTGLTTTSYELNTTLYANADYDILVEACDAEFCTGFNWSSNIDVGEYFRILNVTTWTGNTSNNWFTASNWSPNAVPNSSKSIVIPSTSTHPLISGTSPGNDVTLAATGTLSIEDGATLTLAAGPVLMFESGAAVSTIGSGKIILEPDAVYLNLSNSAPVLEVRRTLTASKGWRMVASPVSAKLADMFTTPLVTQGFTGSTYPAKQPNLMWWDETEPGTTLQSWRKPANLTDDIVGGRGHFHYVFNGAGITGGGTYADVLPQNMSVTGVENFNGSGSFNFNLSYTARTPVTTGTDYYDVNALDQGWNLIGNPTASTLDWDAASAWIKTNIDNTIYVWDPSALSGNGDYLTWNGSTGTLANGKIPPFQAFWVHANTTSPVLSFTNTAKAATAGTFMRSPEVNKSVIVPITLTSNGMETTSFISFTNNGIKGPDNKDAYRLEPMNDTWIELYTLSSPDHVSPLTINNLPLNDSNLVNIPLFIGAQMAESGINDSFTLKWEIPENWPSEWIISLQNHQISASVSMTDNVEYSFNKTVCQSVKSLASDVMYAPKQLVKLSAKKDPTTTKLPDFSIIISKNGKDIDYIKPLPHFMLIYPNTFSYSTTLRFSLPKSEQVRLEVNNMNGIRVETLTNQVYPPGINEIQWYPNSLMQGIYFIRFISGDVVVTRKVIYKN